MQDRKVKVTVNIMGNEYTMVGRESEEYLQSVALYVDKKMRELHKKNGMLNNLMVAILTALNVADEYFKLQQELEVVKKEASKPGKELEDSRYQLRKAKEEISRLNSEVENLRQQLGNSQEEASNIYNEWLKAQKEIKELGGKIDFLEEQNKELEIKLSLARNEEKRLKEELEEFLKTFDNK
jgi:cell division protein ZapA